MDPVLAVSENALLNGELARERDRRIDGDAFIAKFLERLTALAHDELKLLMVEGYFFSGRVSRAE